MEFLRSPRVHHIDVNSNSLHQFALDNYENPSKCYAPPYNRPSLELFRRHSQWVISRNKLNKLLVNDRAIHLKERSNGLSISCSSGTLEARRLLLCIGLEERQTLPGWGQTLYANNRTIFHIFDPNIPPLDKLDVPTSLVIVGGGLTAFQTAITCSRYSYSRILIILRHSEHVSQFDTDPGWIGPKYLKEFHRIQDYADRRKVIDVARNRGSVPQEILTQLNERVDRGQIDLIYGKVERCSENEDGSLQLRLKGELKPINADKIILATGFCAQRPGGDFINQAVNELNLPCACCRYPIVDKALRWHPRIFVSGPLCELEIGPVARNIIGARLAARRLLTVL